MEELEEMFEMQQEEEEMMAEEEEAAMEDEDDVTIYESAEFEEEIKNQLGNMQVSSSDVTKNIDASHIAMQAKSHVQRYVKG